MFPYMLHVYINRYNEESCETLKPMYKEESYALFNLGLQEQEGSGENDGDGSNSRNPPRKASQRNPPFQIEIGFDNYRRNRKYEGIWFSNIGCDDIC